MAEPANSPKVSPSDSIPLDIEPITSKDTPTETAAEGQDGKTNGDASGERILEKETESLETGVSSEGAIAAAPEATVEEAAEVCFSGILCAFFVPYVLVRISQLLEWRTKILWTRLMWCVSLGDFLLFGTDAGTVRSRTGITLTRQSRQRWTRILRYVLGYS